MTTFPITVMVTDSAGASATASTSATTTTGSDPWAVLDGRVNAPSGAAQYPTLLNGYPAAMSPNARVRWPVLTGTQPPWMVAGVDYAVGVPSGTVLKNPATISIAGVSVNTTSHSITVSGSNITLDGYDFSLNNGWNVNVTGPGCTIKNSYWKINGTSQQPIMVPVGGFSPTILYCTLDGNAIDTTTSALINSFGTGLLTVKYCWLHNSSSDCISSGMSSNSLHGSLLFAYNLFDNDGMKAGAHSDWNQIGSGIWDSIQIIFNTGYQHSSAQGTQGFSLGSYVVGSTTSSAEGGYNTMISVGLPLYQTTYFIAPEANQSATVTSIHDNYVDPTSSLAPLTTRNTHSTYTNNISMLTGSVVT